MSDMLSSFVKKEMDRQIKENYPHIQYPSGVFAKVVQVKEQNTYTLKILDKSLNEDRRFPEIPYVKSSIELAVGDIAAVILLYGGSNIFILGRYDA